MFHDNQVLWVEHEGEIKRIIVDKTIYTRGVGGIIITDIGNFTAKQLFNMTFNMDGRNQAA